MKFTSEDLVVGRVVFEDDSQMTLEILKNDEATFTLDEETPDRFFILAFIKAKPVPHVWKPWEV